MAREFAITMYLFVFRIIFHIFTLFPQKKKTTFVASFGDNVLYTVKELEKQIDNEQIVILKTSQCKVNFTDDPNRMVIGFENRNVIHWFRSIYHLATSSKIIVDNYFGFLAVTPFKTNVVCIQLWHAAGAIKQFGLKDPSIQHRSPRAIERFRQVYDRFDYVVVGCDKMATIFQQSFDISDDRILRTGIPRTDFFFDSLAQNEAEHSLTSIYPVMNEKKVILYAPTFRDHELNVSALQLDIEKMYTELKDEFVLFLRLHPAVKVDLTNLYPGFVFDVSAYHNVNHLLVVTDILITDYSSIPFEFSLLDKPMVFFAYDLEEYTQSRGFWEKYEELAPGPIVYNTNELITVLKNEQFHMEQIRTFAQQWNEYSTGRASEQLVKNIYQEVERSY
ncbi:CDP-glycerol glycerophosphotransferase family protein [Lederbergia lenta]|nr:CDP-glycerol glycerophosphotransferase family protein [Lederbergia lenta]MCM3112013.1 CDP-glycerol glycerophosphotransferase family protein [Lederbergia lenta]MEC2323185.1 CDP-glycerol glycerophosphotransferase family protein [Lederbergia lenta]